MADLAISALPAVTPLAGTEVLPVVQGGTTKKATIDEVGTRVVPTLVSAFTNDAGYLGSADNLTSSRVLGTTTNDDAAAGFLGAYDSFETAFVDAIALSDSVPATVALLALTAGDWDVSGTGALTLTAGTLTQVYASISETDDALAADPFNWSALPFSLVAANADIFAPTPVCRVSLAAPASIYLTLRGDFSAGGLVGYGRIRARRVR